MHHRPHTKTRLIPPANNFEAKVKYTLIHVLHCRCLKIKNHILVLTNESNGTGFWVCACAEHKTRTRGLVTLASLFHVFSSLGSIIRSMFCTNLQTTCKSCTNLSKLAIAASKIVKNCKSYINLLKLLFLPKFPKLAKLINSAHTCRNLQIIHKLVKTCKSRVNLSKLAISALNC